MLLKVVTMFISIWINKKKVSCLQTKFHISYNADPKVQLIITAAVEHLVHANSNLKIIQETNKSSLKTHKQSIDDT